MNVTGLLRADLEPVRNYWSIKRLQVRDDDGLHVQDNEYFSGIKLGFANFSPSRAPPIC